MLPSSIISQAKAIILIVVLASYVGGYLYIKDLRNQIQIKQTEVQQYKIATEQQSKLIADTAKQIDQVQTANKSLMEVISTHEKTIRDLQERFNVQANGQSRDLGAITRAKPKLIQNIVNKATKNVNRCFEIATGSKVKPNETNNECKELINDD